MEGHYDHHGDTLVLLENAKLDKHLSNIPADHFLSQSGVCRTTADKDTGEITDNPCRM